MDVSVIITTFNQPFHSIQRSIISALYQENIEFEIIIADDCSNIDLFDRYRDLFSLFNYTNYRLIRNETNLKTVRNIANALKYATAPYVKTIDAGDMLYSSLTLRNIVDFCREYDVKVGFGDIVRFRQNDDGAYFASNYNAPRCAAAFDLNAVYNAPMILKHQMSNADWIPAAAQFYQTSVYKELLSNLSEKHHVRYCQDFTSVTALETYRIYHYPSPIYWYEWGVGISTNGSIDSRKRLYQDHENFYKGMVSNKPFGINLNSALAKFKARKLIAFSPLYEPIVNIVGRYDFQEWKLEDRFFSLCSKC